ncbi:DUF6090 family protein [Maribacter sp. CXY002]|uniref:DUF6090 family protein n=1 Tax=Maribacter luteocoastalis TaxID=3407671 RepID=UPI003B670911
MIKFFRKIRQKLLSEGNTGKYLKYAIGEIVLVVIGILIALQINNWNEERKDRRKEQVVLKKLKDDYLANLSQLEEKMATRDKIIFSAVQLIKAFDQPMGVVRDSVIKDIAIINNDPTFDPIKNDLTSSDNLILIGNERLNHLLSNWSSDVVALKEIELVWSEKSNGQLDIITAEMGIGRDVSNYFMNDTSHLWLLDQHANPYKTGIGNSRLGAPLDEILENYKLEAMTASATSLNKSANIQSEALRNRILEILRLIDEEIKE